MFQLLDCVFAELYTVQGWLHALAEAVETAFHILSSVDLEELFRYSSMAKATVLLSVMPVRKVFMTSCLCSMGLMRTLKLPLYALFGSWPNSWHICK